MDFYSSVQLDFTINLKYFIQLFGVTSKSYINFNNFGRKVTKSGKIMISTTTAT